MQHKETKADQDNNLKLRLSKVIASTGFCSRRKAEEFISLGKVLVNGKVVTEQGFKVNPEADIIKIENKKIFIIKDKRYSYYVFNKPSGYLTTKSDPEKRPIVFDLLPKKFKGYNSVGRLDYNTEGILIFTNDGDLLNKLTHPKYNVRRRYLVRAQGIIDQKIFKKIAKEGTDIDGVLVSNIGFSDIRYTESYTWFEIEIGEGKNREVKKIVKNMGAEVNRLKRIAYGTIYKNIPPKGKVRELSPEEVESLIELVKANE